MQAYHVGQQLPFLTTYLSIISVFNLQIEIEDNCSSYKNLELLGVEPRSARSSWVHANYCALVPPACIYFVLLFLAYVLQTHVRLFNCIEKKETVGFKKNGLESLE